MAGAPRQPADGHWLLQLTDLHLTAPGVKLLGVDTDRTLSLVLTQALSERRPDALLLTGDIAHDPSPAVYARCLARIREHYDGPLYALPGNHDVTAAMRCDSLGGLLRGDEFQLGPWTVLLFDSHRDDHPHARFSDRDIRRLLQRARAATGRYWLFATHHPPITVGSPWLDADRIQSGPELLECLGAEAAARALLFGHVHQAVDIHYQRLRLLGTPSTCFPFKAGSTEFAIGTGGPGYRWLRLTDEGRLETRVGEVRADGIAADPALFAKN